MIEKIEITQRFNFKRLNRHYECFTIDFLNNSAYYKISERGSGDKFLSESELCDSTWCGILSDLRRKMTSEIHRFSDDDAGRFLKRFDELKLFEGFESENFKYFEKIELIYSCIVIIYSTEGYYEYSFKNNFPANWKKFGEILKDLFGFDVLHLNHQMHLATPLYFDIRKDGVYLAGKKLSLRMLEFGHYRTYPYDVPKPRLILDFESRTMNGYLEGELDCDLVLSLLEGYHVYSWIFDDYHRKADARDPDDLEGYDWYLEMLFEGDVIWHIFGYNDYPDTYVALGREIMGLCDMDLLEIGTIAPDDINLFDKFCSEILSK